MWKKIAIAFVAASLISVPALVTSAHAQNSRDQTAQPKSSAREHATKAAKDKMEPGAAKHGSEAKPAEPADIDLDQPAEQE